jgi:hypothetical protein
MEHVIGGKFKLGRKIGSGSFGELYLGTVLTGFIDLSFVSVCLRCEALYLVRYCLIIYCKVDYIVCRRQHTEQRGGGYQVGM